MIITQRLDLHREMMLYHTQMDQLDHLLDRAEDQAMREREELAGQFGVVYDDE